MGGVPVGQRERVMCMHPVGGLRPPYYGMLETGARPPPHQNRGCQRARNAIMSHVNLFCYLTVVTKYGKERQKQTSKTKSVNKKNILFQLGK